MGEPAIDGFPMARKPAEVGRNRPNLWARRLAAAADFFEEVAYDFGRSGEIWSPIRSTM